MSDSDMLVAPMAKMMENRVVESVLNSKHWFMTSFLQHTAVFSCAIGSRKLSANEQFFVGAQTVVSLLQTTEIKQGVSFIAANKVYISTNKTSRLNREGTLFLFFYFVTRDVGV